MSKLILLDVLSVLFDNANQTPVLLLKERDGKRVLPIWIGFFEAQSIILALKGVIFHRPLTHDLCLDIILSLGAKLLRTNINNLDNGTFYAQLVLEHNGKEFIVDGRPSDCIAIALRQSIPIYVNSNIMKMAAIPDEEHITRQKWEDILSRMPDEAFGKYSM